MRISDWSSDVCSSDLQSLTIGERLAPALVSDWLQAEGYHDISSEPTAFEETLISASRDGQPISIEIHAHGSGTSAHDMIAGRSDERSVGKECASKSRSRWSPDN